MPYDPSNYWRDLHRRDDLSAVGQSALPPGINLWLYRTLARNLGRFVHRHRLDAPPPGSVFDVGAGTGYWVDWWLTRGVRRVEGCDLVADAVTRLNERYGQAGCRFRVADITDSAGLGSDRYDLVNCQNVLLHVTDDDLFRRALANVASLVAPGGALVLTEPILLYPEYEIAFDPEKHSRSRPLAAYRDPLTAAGLTLVAVEGATVLAANPIEAGSPAAYARSRRWWRSVSRRSKRRPDGVGWLGRLIYHLDPMVLRAGAAPSAYSA